MRTIKPTELKPLLVQRNLMLLDVRRKADLNLATTQLPGALWKDPELIADWCGELPKDREVVIYCVRGGSVSNSVVDRLQVQGVQARFIEGGIEAWAQSGGVTVPKTGAPS